MDFDSVRALPRFRAIPLLSRVFGGVLRWQALRHERRFAAHCRLHAAALLPQLVSSTLSICRFGVPVRAPLDEKTKYLADPSAARPVGPSVHLLGTDAPNDA